MGRLGESMANGFWGALSMFFGIIFFVLILFLIYYFIIRRIDWGEVITKIIKGVIQ